jgi:hypothetical protein
MKSFYFILLPVLLFIIACKKTDNNTKIRSFDEPTEHSINNVTIIKSNNDKGKVIQYISWENVLWFSNYETFVLHTHDRMTGDGVEYNGTYTLEILDNITFLNMHFDSGNDEKWLILANGTLCDIYKSDGKFIHGVTGSVNRDDIIWFCPEIVSSSSYLVDNNISYSPDNLGVYNKTDKPWVEGVKGYGINEKIFFKKGSIHNGSMHISIGYVSYDKPYLYNQNSRPKKIKLSVGNKFSIIADLKDTPHYQEIKLPSNIDQEDILILEILEVYQGTKYEDTCINTIYFEWNSGRYEINNYWEN